MAEDFKTVAGRRFDAVVGPHFDALYRAAMRLTRCREDAEDLVQDVCLRAFPHLARLATLESPRGWLLHVQYRIFVDGVRHRTRSPMVATNEAGACELAASEEPGPDELTEAHLGRRRLASVWHELDCRQRALLALHAEGYTLGELEEITGMSRNTIGVRLHRARARLAKLLGNESTGRMQLVRMEA